MSALTSLFKRSSDRAGWRGDGSPRSTERMESRTRGAGQDERLASFLGWFSIGLGLTEVIAPREFARFIGVSDREDNRKLVRMVGLRELACGVGILTRPRPAGWVWARVAGDAMDLALLGSALTSNAPGRDRVAAATLAVVGVTALDVYDGVRLSQRSDGSGRTWDLGSIHVRYSITVNRPAEELYNFWHNFENLPEFMSHLESVRKLDDRRSHWKARGPAGTTVEWDAEITEDRPNELIAWRSLPGADVDNCGSVRFVKAPGNRGTEVHVELTYHPPGGPIGAATAWLFGEEPRQQVGDDLYHFKQLMETGEVVLSEGTFDGSRFVQRPAQPPPSVSRR
jgi:uncharacterized membrane protein